MDKRIEAWFALLLLLVLFALVVGMLLSSVLGLLAVGLSKG
ncbi:MAG: hypothetical protein Q7L55_11640 [Actinomycetota bacterium]|nr:hypothetical protein [Actinomycetota bacterium]